MEPTKNNRLEVFFIRHKPAPASQPGPTEQDIEALKKLARIAIFYENKPVNDVVENVNYVGNNIKYNEEVFTEFEDNCTTYKSALNKIWRLGKHGGIVVSEYNKDAKCLIGIVQPNTRIEPFSRESSNFTFNVTLKLEKTVEIEYSKYPVYLAARPPFQTICNPTSSFFKTVIPAIYIDPLGKVQPTRRLLHPKMLEQMCVEYLRTVHFENNQRLKYCILRPGKNLPIIDIAGVSTDNRDIFAQVKADKIKPRALKEFRKFMKDPTHTIYIIFCEGVKNRGTDKGITYIDVDTVFDHFNNNKEGKEMIRRMIGFPV